MTMYVLIRAHKINRVWQEPGYEIDMPEQTGEWLVQQGVLQRKYPEAAPTPNAPPMKRGAPPRTSVAVTPSRWACCGRFK